MTAGRLGTAALLLGLVAAAWALLVARADSMMMRGPLSYLGVWIAMTVAMMLPSAAPMLLLVDRLSRRATPWFALGYLLAWSAFGAGSYFVTSHIGWHEPATLLVAAGVYQALPLKRACLRRCRQPLAFLRRHADDPALVAGIRHGAFCVGCCFGLMVALLALGMASLVWMAVAGLAILGEKTLPRGEWLAPASAFVLVGSGAWLAIA
jgi:predicted metal-binding membrane protein